MQAVVTSTSEEVLQSTTTDNADKSKSLSFLTNNIINGDECKFELAFKLSESEILGIELMLLSGPKHFNEIHLKYHVLSLLDELIGGEHNGGLKKYTVRTYSSIFNSHPMRDEYFINSDYRFLIKPHEWTSKQEPMTEQIVLLDTEIEAVNVEHARSLAYNHTRNTNAYLSVLLDVGFETMNSEFRVFTIKQGDEFSLSRFRTGFLDYELGLAVKDNHYGLKSMSDSDHVNSFHSGKMALNFSMEKSDGGYEFLGVQTYDTISNNDFLEELFSTHEITRKNCNSKAKPVFKPISESPHYPVEEIIVPTDIRKYFKNISNLEESKKEVFLSCCRMYNIALTLGRNQPTLEQSYKICSIEALSKFEKLSFSDFMVKYGRDDFDRKLSDYFYSVRSSHFHAGKFYFDEYSMNMQREIAFSFQEKTDDYFNFSRYIRIAIVNWVMSEILGE
ncbi:hypothetical protein DU505_13695 [Billgrantia montanilacus]|uniref:Uncharacterized protein n=1 Tax=Billgrantia montanilacus TaxID=2282305 RepID=A0A368TX03_9GAMM|nr:hypothetical protein DU505_13695 [Halomonas montanilacus]